MPDGGCVRQADASAQRGNRAADLKVRSYMSGGEDRE
jgi:hypothetical protein